MKYFDFHCDALYRCVTENIDFDSYLLTVNKNDVGLFSKYYQCFAVWTPPETADKSRYVNDSLNLFNKQIKSLSSETFSPILTIEDVTFLADDFSLFERLINEKVFSVSLTWNYENAFAGGALSKAGLKPDGAELIERLNNNRIVLDLSHLNRKSFFDAIDRADRVVASHTYIDDLYKHDRNLTLEQMKLLKERNGLIGLCFYPEFMGTTDVFEGIYKAISFCAENQLADHIAFGSDFDGADTPVSLRSISLLYEYLRQKGLDEFLLDGVFFDNAYNYYKPLTNTES